MLFSGAAPRRPPDRVQVAEFPYFSEAPLYVAADEGFFAAENLEVDFRRVQLGSPASLAAMVRGEIDVDTGGPQLVTFNAIARGAQFRWVAEKGHVEPGDCTQWAFVVRRELLGPQGRLDPARARGARARYIPTVYSSYLLDRALGLEGLRLEDLQRIDIPNELLEESLEHGEVQLANLAEIPLVKAAGAPGLATWKKLSDFDPRAVLSGIVFGPRLLGKDRDVGIRFLMAYLRGVRALRRGKTARNVEILSRRYGMTPAEIRSCCWLTFDPDGRLDPSDWIEYEKWSFGRGQLDRVMTAAEFEDSSLVAEARRRLAARNE